MRRIPELDALRALAAIAVLFFHLNPARFFFGSTGVDLFFVLSGFLITDIILRFHHQPRFFINFYLRRGLRIWPIYYLVLISLLAANPFVPSPEPTAAWPFYASYSQNTPLYWGKSMPPFILAFDHSWTLAIEEQFYLVWPALVAWAGRKRVAWLCIATIAISWKLRSGGEFLLFFFPPPMSIRLLLARADGFAIGGLLAWFFLVRQSLSRRQTTLITAAAAAGFAVAMIYVIQGCARVGPIRFLGLPTPADPANTILAVNLLAAALITAAATFQGNPATAFLRLKPLVFLGQISYGLYLYHYPLYWLIDRCQFRYGDDLTNWATKLGATLLVATASWFLIEQPILQLKNRFPYSPPNSDITKAIDASTVRL
jgi:peptidoglycan/LPS O-acetylase OafA/YrhL